jgi:hypothetical protein
MAAPHIRGDLHALPGAFPADAVTSDWVVPESWATMRHMPSAATHPPHSSAPNVPAPLHAAISVAAARIAPHYVSSPSAAPVVTPRIHAWLGSPSARLSRAHVAPSMMEVPHILG